MPRQLLRWVIIPKSEVDAASRAVEDGGDFGLRPTLPFRINLITKIITGYG